MINLQAAINYAIQMKGRSLTIEDLDTATTYQLKGMSANYFRNFAGFEELAIEGREWVFSKTDIDASGIDLKRNIRIIDSELGEDTIIEVREMSGIFGQIIGYRVRTG